MTESQVKFFYPTATEPKEMPAEDAKYKNGSRASLDDASGFHIKKAEILESVKPDEVLEPVNIVDRIDNLLAADSDHVVDILRPAVSLSPSHSVHRVPHF